ncbi:hypothetical protein ABZ359_35460 [Streptomyces sp. NPDC005968]|uniref:hypothetical protein n=1 Tax=Streptomyces sp. NPDC005968 TaxID=3154574 RepID=UPI0033FB8C1D
MDEHEQRGVQAANANEQGDHGDEVEQAGLLPSDPVARTVPQFMVYQPASQPAAAERHHVKVTRKMSLLMGRTLRGDHVGERSGEAGAWQPGPVDADHPA